MLKTTLVDFSDKFQRTNLPCQYRKAVLTSRKRGFTKPSYDAADKSGFYAPVFPLGTTKAQINDELRRLHARYPLCIAGPIFLDPDMGLLSLGEE